MRVIRTVRTRFIFKRSREKLRTQHYTVYIPRHILFRKRTENPALRYIWWRVSGCPTNIYYTLKWREKCKHYAYTTCTFASWNLQFNIIIPTARCPSRISHITRCGLVIIALALWVKCETWLKLNCYPHDVPKYCYHYDYFKSTNGGGHDPTALRLR